VTAAFPERLQQPDRPLRPPIRTHEQIIRFFDGFTLIEPGLVWGFRNGAPTPPTTFLLTPPSTG